MKALVTGANGMLGQDLVPIFENEGIDVYPTAVEDLDITDINAVKLCLSKSMPDLVVNLAAYTNVDAAETDRETAYAVNQSGVANIAKVTADMDIPVLHISTDYVFDGTNKSSYLPADKTGPLNVYGDSKLKGEQALRELNPKHYIIRTSWLYGKHGKNFVDTMIDLASKNTLLKVVNDQTGCPTWTVALTNALLTLLKCDKPYGTYHICGSGKTTWYDFAKKIFEYTGVGVEVVPVPTEEFPRPAKRPHYSVMQNEGACPDWEESLKEYLNERSCLSERYCISGR